MMIWGYLLKLVSKNMWRHRLRTMLTMLTSYLDWLRHWLVDGFLQVLVKYNCCDNG